MPSERLRIAWFSVLNGGSRESASLSAYVSGCLLPLLRERFEIELFHDSFAAYPGFPTRHFLEAAFRHREKPYDIFFYQLEDGRAANFIRIHLGLMPGAVLFHDLMLSSFGPEPILNSPWQETIRKFEDPDHPWPPRGAEFTQPGPLAYREAAYAAVPLCSNPASTADFKNNVALRLSAAGKQAGPVYLPLPVPPEAFSAAPAGQGQGLSIGFCGTPRIEHRAHKLFEALSQLKSPWKLHWLLEPEERTQAEEMVREFELEHVVFHEGRSPQHWLRLLPSCNTAVHTLFSVFGQPGPYLQLSLAAGLPALVTRFASCDALPDNVVWKIEPGECEARQMLEVLRTAASGGFRPERTAAAAYAREMFDARMVAAELAQVFLRNADYLRHIGRRWDELVCSAERSLLQELRQIAGPAGWCSDDMFEGISRKWEGVMRELQWSR